MPSRASDLFQTGARVSFSGSVLRVFSFLSVVKWTCAVRVRKMSWATGDVVCRKDVEDEGLGRDGEAADDERVVGDAGECVVEGRCPAGWEG